MPSQANAVTGQLKLDFDPNRVRAAHSYPRSRYGL